MIRNGELIDFQTVETAAKGGLRHSQGRGQNFIVEFIKADAGSSAWTIESAYEAMVLLPDVGARFTGVNETVSVKARSLVILPAGKVSVQLAGAGTCCILTSNAGEPVSGKVENAATYAARDERVAPFGTPYRRLSDPQSIRVLEIDAIDAPQDNPRLKMFQSATLSINWVEYAGPRDRKALSPHAHKSFEQGSLALAGEFRHHLRVEWGKNAEVWQEDRHVVAPSPSLLVIPPQIIHTTEGVNDERHLLIDIFSPPRADFIAKNWVANSAEYEAPPAQP
ncbi:MAG TPA: hypothetical protein VGU72_25345 [Beijerinckiaceae bacterium]|jgi:hypothetical protein|nr:hypothetical protein [Beijerinckiaceae bacterium]